MIDIIDLLEVHADFIASLHRIRIAVMDRKMATAAAELAWLRPALTEHIKGEETLLFPWYEDEDVPANGSKRAIARDHRMLEKHLQVSLQDRGPIALADDLTRFAGLVEHHNERESRFFKPRLDQVIPADEKRKILAWFEASIAALPPVSAPADDDPAPIGPVPGDSLARCRFDLATGGGSPEQITALPVTETKAIRLRDRAAAHLEHGDRLAAYDDLRLLSLFEHRQT